MIGWVALLKRGDWLLIGLGLACVVASFPLAWQAGVADKAVVRLAGELYSELDLRHDRRLDVPGPLGVTTVLVDRRRVRIAADPSPRQYCVRQGWLARPGEVAICAPNQVSVEVQGARRTYDSLAY